MRRGQGLVEYTVLLVMVVALAVGGWKVLSGSVGRAVETTSQRLQGQVAAPIEAGRVAGPGGPPGIGFAGPGWGDFDAEASPNHRQRPPRRSASERRPELVAGSGQ